MLVKIYAFAWLLLIAAAGALLGIVGSTELVLTVFGFAFSTLFFAGIVAVLPWQMDKHYSRHVPAKNKTDTSNLTTNVRGKAPVPGVAFPMAAAI
ncbi:MAG TPA: hypothetical protein VJV05_14475 [Pyrinomonadaceae bacterium]|nr:hypothetical protein [Pyrinomonadaceae bacterium]